MSPKSKARFQVEIHPDYLGELRRRVETGPGLAAVAGAAEMERGMLWRCLHGKTRVTVDTAERVRAALSYLEEDSRVPMPPPIVSVQSTAHHAWIGIGEALLADAPDVMATALASPERLRLALHRFFVDNDLK